MRGVSDYDFISNTIYEKKYEWKVLSFSYKR